MRQRNGVLYRIGINTFGLAKHMQADQRKTIQRLAEIGFSLVEPLLAPNCESTT